MKRLGIILVALGSFLIVGVGSAPTAVPTVPSGPTGIALNGSMELAWQAVTGATSYRVYRGTTPTSIDQELTSGSGVTSPSFTDTTAANGTSYYYTVRAVSSDGASAPSLTVQGTPGAASCSSGNVVVVENCRPGSTTWRVVNAGSVAGGGIEGYATAASVNKGESVNLKVNSGGAPFRVEIYRSGYYGGSGARLFSTVRGIPNLAQPTCIKDSNLGLTDCSNWSVSATITTTSAWPSGVYLLRIVRDDTASDNHILLVVRDDARHSELLYGASFTTYQAYNNYGGKSLYDSSSSGAVTVSGGTRAVKVSFDRPFEQPRSGRRDWYSKVDYPLVYWLERSGYDVAYSSNTDLVRNGARVQDHRAYISPVHDEYYSANMRAALEQARDAGTSLFMSSGNAVFWKVRFENGAGGQDRVMVCYKSSQSGGPDPSGTPTGTWRDPNGANNPENALLGAMYIGDADNTFFPLRVSAAEGQDPVWRHTSLATLSPGTFGTVGSSIVGWEWDARVANGREPANVVTVASSPVTGNLLQFDGTYNYYTSGSAAVNVVKYKAASGALVFSTGTNFWARGLAVNADGAGNVQLTIQQATTNVLADMGVLPQTPASDIVVDDPNAPPTVTSQTPDPGATGISRSTVVGATFSLPMAAGTITGSSFTLTGPSGAVAGSVAYDAGSQTATLTPSGPLEYSTSYTARLDTTVTSQNGVSLTNPVTWSFTTSTACPCSLFPSALVPVSTGNPTKDGRAGSGPWSYELGVRVTVDAPTSLTAIRFYKDPLETGTHTGKVWSSAGTVLASTVFSGESASGWQQQGLAAPLQLQPGTTYVVSVNLKAYFVVTNNGLQSQISSGPLRSLTDKNGVYGSAAGVFPNTGSSKKANYFVDAVVVDQGSPPTVVSTVPAAGATDVSRTSSVSARFSRAMAASTITGASFTLTGPSGAVAGSVAYDAGSQTATLTPGAPLAYSTTYTARLATTITADDGTPLTSAYSWSFTTVAAVAPTVTGRSPADGAAGVSTSAAVTATFSRAMNASTITGASFTLTGPSGAVAGSVAYDAGSQTATLTPGAPLASSTTYTARLDSAITADDGTALAAPVTWSFTTSTACPCSLFSSTLVPVSTGNPTKDGRAGSGPWSYELGVRVTVDAPTSLTAIRFYKDPLETGTHTGKVWSSAGTVLASTVFSGESASGWQQQGLAAPLQLQPGTTYVVSVNANAYFVVTNNGLQSQISSGPLRSLTDKNGVYGSAAGVFPNTGSSKKANYFVDAVVVDQGSPPTVVSTVPAAGATDVSRTSSVSARFSRAMAASTITGASFTLTGPSGAVAGSVAYDAGSQTATLTPGAPLAYSTTYTARLATTITADDGTPLTSAYSWSFTTVAAVAPTVTGRSPADGAAGVSTSAAVTATFSRAMNASTITGASFTLTGPSGAVAGSVAYDAGSQTATLTPGAPLASSTTYTARLDSAITADDGTALAAPVTWSFTTAAACPCSLFSSTLVPVSTGNPTKDGRAGSGPWSYELGVRVTVDAPTSLTAIRFYKDPLETGTHTGKVWSSAGTVLASVSFTGESASGWQEQGLSTPLQLQPGTTYVVSVNANAYFVLTNNGLQSQISSGPLRSLTDKNGVYGSAADVFPDAGSSTQSNYFVDLVVG